MSVVWTRDDRALLHQEIQATHHLIDQLTGCTPVSEEAAVERDGMVVRCRKELGRLERLQEEIDEGSHRGEVR